MPRFSLRQEGHGTLGPLAPFKVLAVMCHPNDRIRREQMLAHIQVGTGVGIPRRQGLSGDEFFEEVRQASPRAAIAGGLLITMLQLHLNHLPFGLNRALPLVSALLPEWWRTSPPSYSKDWHLYHQPRSRKNMLEAYNQFRGVAHLWAALIHAEQHGRQDIWPGSCETLPTFLAFAQRILEMACALPSRARDRRFVISPSETWAFTIPQSQIMPVRLIAFPPNEQQQRILNERKARTLLI